MSLLHLDGVEDGLNNAGKYWAGYTGVVTSPVRTAGTKAASSLANPHFHLLPANEHATLIMGAPFYWNGEAGRIFTLRSDDDFTTHGWLYITGGGQVQVFRGDGTVLATSAMAAPITPNTWHCVEFKSVLHDSTGAAYVHVDEVSVISTTGLDTKNGGTKTVYDSVIINEHQKCYWDDFYICNGAGTVDNDFLGDCVVLTSYPTGDGSSSVLVGSDGNSVNNYALVDEASLDTADYVGSATSGDKDLYAFGDLAYATGAIKGVIVNMYAAKSDAGARTARAVTRSGGTNYSGSDKTLSTTYTTYREILELDPATSAAWTVSGFNAAEFGFEARP